MIKFSSCFLQTSLLLQLLLVIPASLSLLSLLSIFSCDCLFSFVINSNSCSSLLFCTCNSCNVFFNFTADWKYLFCSSSNLCFFAQISADSYSASTNFLCKAYFSFALSFLDTGDLSVIGDLFGGVKVAESLVVLLNRNLDDKEEGIISRGDFFDCFSGKSKKPASVKESLLSDTESKSNDKLIEGTSFFLVRDVISAVWYNFFLFFLSGFGDFDGGGELIVSDALLNSESFGKNFLIFLNFLPCFDDSISSKKLLSSEIIWSILSADFNGSLGEVDDFVLNGGISESLASNLLPFFFFLELLLSELFSSFIELSEKSVDSDTSNGSSDSSSESP